MGGFLLLDVVSQSLMHLPRLMGLAIGSEGCEEGGSASEVVHGVEGII